MMRLLAIDTAAETVGVAVAVDGGVRSEIVEASATQHSRRLFRMVDAALDGADLRKEELTHVAVTRGPGSFTGLRVGLASAKGIAYALGVPLVGVGTLEAMARSWMPFPGTVAALLDARKSQVYAAAWDGLSGRVRVTEGAWAPAEFARELAAHPEGPVLLGGSGFGAHQGVFAASLGNRLLHVDRSRWHVSPRLVALVAHADAEAGRAADPALLVPVYHRLSEAEEKMRAR